MAAIDEHGPPKPGGKPGALTDAKKFFTAHRNETVAAGAAGVIGLALLHKRNQQAADSTGALDSGATGSQLPDATDAGYTYPTTESGGSSGDGSFPKTLNVTIKQPRTAPPSPKGRKPKPRPRPKPKPKPKAKQPKKKLLGGKKVTQGPKPPTRNPITKAAQKRAVKKQATHHPSGKKK